MPKRVIIIDDDHGPIEFYVKALRLCHFEVTHLDTLDAGLRHFADPGEPADFYVLDMMLPIAETGEDVLPKCGYKNIGFGMTAGLLLFERLRIRLPKVPVLVLTSISRPDILDKIPLDEHSEWRAKVNLLPFELSDLVRKSLAS